MTYAELIALVQNTVQSSETNFVANLPDFVKAAESDVYLNTQIPDLRKNQQGTLTASNEYLSAPTDYLSTYSLAVIDSGNHYYLFNKEVDFIREAYPARLTTGRPRFYSLFDDDTFLLAPTPDSGYTVELHYFYKPESIVTASSSWLGTNAPNALLYGTLVHAYTYLKGEQDVMQMYESHFQKAIEALQILTEGRARKDTYRQANARMPV